MGTQREKVIVQGEDQLSQPLRRSQSGFENFSGALRKAAIYGGIGLALNKLRQLGGASLQLAVDAEEAGAAFETAMGTAMPAASRFVDEFATKAGFARHELEQMLAITASQIQGLGATEAASAALAERMARLAGDVASFSNAAGGAQEVMRALQSATNGEYEALKRFGIALNISEASEAALIATGKTHEDQLTRLEKAQAVVNLAYEKAAKAVGDLDRTQDSAANRQRQLSAAWKDAQVAIGQGLMPALEALLPVVKGLIGPVELLASGIGAILAPFGEAALPAVASKVLNDLNATVERGTATIEDYARALAVQMAAGVEFTEEKLVAFGARFSLTRDEMTEALWVAREWIFVSGEEIPTAARAATDAFLGVTDSQAGMRERLAGTRQALEAIPRPVTEIEVSLYLLQTAMDRIDPGGLSRMLIRMGASFELALAPLDLLPGTVEGAIDAAIGVIGGSQDDWRDALAEIVEMRQLEEAFEGNLAAMGANGMAKLAEELRTHPNRREAIEAAAVLATEEGEAFGRELETQITESTAEAIRRSEPYRSDPIAAAMATEAWYRHGYTEGQSWWAGIYAGAGGFRVPTDPFFGQPAGPPAPPSGTTDPFFGVAVSGSPSRRALTVGSINVTTVFPADQETRRRAALDIYAALDEYAGEVNPWQRSS